MVADTPSPLAGSGPGIRFWLARTPLTGMIVYCLISLFLKENYPFTHYPMYSNPSGERSYYVVADAASHAPLPVADLTDITCAKIGKIWRTKTVQHASKVKKNKSDLGPEDHQTIGLSIFAQLRGYAKEKGRQLPPRLQLSRMNISSEDGRIIETPELLASE